MASLYSRLWAHFLSHSPVRRWLFHPCSSSPQRPLTQTAISRSLAFVCDFPIPPSLANSASSFALGELFVPVKTYGRFILGFLVAASPHHKVAASVSSYPSQSSLIARTVVVDPGEKEDDPLLLLDFAWFLDQSLIVAAKQLTPVNSDLPVTGVIAFYSNFNNLSRPYAVATFVENARRFLLPSSSQSSNCEKDSPPPESALSVARLAAAAQKSHYSLLSSDSDQALPYLTSVAKRAFSIRAAGNITVNIRVATMAPDGRFVLANSTPHREMYADFHVATDTQLATLRQVASLSASFSQPNNTASTTLLSSPSSSLNNSDFAHHQQQHHHQRPLPQTCTMNVLNSNHSGQSVDILAALADAERATTDSEACSPPSDISAAPIIGATATLHNNMNKYIENVSPPPPVAPAVTVPTPPLHPLPHPGTLALPPSYTSVKSTHPIHHSAPANMYSFDYSPVSYSNTDALAAVVNASDRVIDRSMFEKFFPVTSNMHRPPTQTITVPISSPAPPQLSPQPIAVSSDSQHPQSHGLAIHSQPTATQANTLAAHSTPTTTQSHVLAVHSTSTSIQSHPLAVHSTPMPAQSHPHAVHVPIPPQSQLQPLTMPRPLPPVIRMSKLTEVRATKRSRSSSGVCTECGKCFFKSGALARHVRYAHAAAPRTIQNAASNSEAERLDCPRCDKTFSQQGSLNRHLRSIHEARKLHCRYCTLAFGQAFDLKRHQRRKHPGRATAIPREALPAIVLRGRARAIITDPSSLH